MSGRLPRRGRARGLGLYNPGDDRNPGRKVESEASNKDEDQKNPLYLPSILQSIFKNLSVQDLLNCALVSKTWYQESRLAAQHGSSRIGFATDGRCPCADLHVFSNSIGELNFVPVNLLCINIFELSHACIGRRNVRDIYGPILNKLKIRFLGINWDAEMDPPWRGRQIINLTKRMRCPAVQLIIELLKMQPNTIEDLMLFNLPKRARLFSVEEMQEGKIRLEKLKVLGAGRELDFNNETEYLVKMLYNEDAPEQVPPRPMIPDIIAVAPNLKLLEKEIQPGEDVAAAVREEMTHIVKDLSFGPMDTHEADMYERFATRNPKLTKFRGFLRGVNHLNRSTWLAMRHMLVCSQATLEELNIDAYVGSMLKPLNIPPFPNVKPVFILDVDFGPWAQQVRDQLLRIDFSKLLPNVEGVEVNEFERHIIDFLDFQHIVSDPFEDDDGRGDGDDEEFQSRNANIKKVLYAPEGQVVTTDALKYIFKLFPSGETLLICPQVEISYSCIWAHGSHIRNLVLDYREDSGPMYNLDAEFCGLSTDEISYLRGMDGEYLEKVNIVPIAPALTHSRLETLKVVLGDVGASEQDTVFLSRVTGYLAFRRMPQLEVKLHCSIPTDIAHLEPFVSEITSLDEFDAMSESDSDL